MNMEQVNQTILNLTKKKPFIGTLLMHIEKEIIPGNSINLDDKGKIWIGDNTEPDKLAGLLEDAAEKFSTK